ncbi:hypothetical protein KSC_088800 [Ktedonobacter sp. SOSP1-52]|uniref:hypothetical protein n=1 Tax=Ktedonobacter sp. SOSP1-52 TaxID=2778366 RepID=UPI0019153415|nr:hypothetical protein [Ktedonobacter sp. SOSP1-52]GHO69988.1 hypothetical protein KSC_088800 [Ktedonobacter sp. SOSP1-52]
MYNTYPASFTRMTRLLAGVSILPALFLPFYEAFLHGGRRAMEINPRAAAYMAAHMIGAYCTILAGFGLIAIYLRYHERMGRGAPLSLILALLGQISYAGLLFIDGFFNPLFAHFDPTLQTQFHSPDFFQAVAQSPLLQSFGIALYTPFLMSLLLIVGYGFLGILLLLKHIFPWPIGVLFLVGGVILGIDLMVPMWVEIAGYAAEGLAIAWSALLILRESQPIAHAEFVA